MAATLRDRKRARTREAIIAAATALFERNGYESTTIADIAEAAEIGSRTFFSYFAGKEDVLFPHGDARIQAVLEAIEAREPADTPADVLLRALHHAGDDNDDLTGRLAALRLRLIATIPAVRGKALQVQMDGQRDIARALAAAFPDRLGEVEAGALVGAFIGAVTGALQMALGDPDRLGDPAVVRETVERATAAALSPYLRPGPA